MTARFICALPGRSVKVEAESPEDACDVVMERYGMYPASVDEILPTAYVPREVSS
ncbi:hypothetical protein P2P98_13120 [Microbacterium sp. Kw_RZR3]|uniref:hypothetical protein n=1 Tax=Microbacterium sp. Kw_RZR3 TaxID=3032903 RepID=UPI0023DA45B2|nr:hypothetical protein [Microbacterium sp. Kw_RZR3]MDF2047102.1 hypothetical protein [Microbacterium sp. Kw_RZR3]